LLGSAAANAEAFSAVSMLLRLESCILLPEGPVCVCVCERRETRGREGGREGGGKKGGREGGRGTPGGRKGGREEGGALRRERRTGAGGIRISVERVSGLRGDKLKCSNAAKKWKRVMPTRHAPGTVKTRREQECMQQLLRKIP